MGGTKRKLCESREFVWLRIPLCKIKRSDLSADFAVSFLLETNSFLRSSADGLAAPKE
jgi:hypothetical protein